MDNSKLKIHNFIETYSGLHRKIYLPVFLVFFNIHSCCLLGTGIILSLKSIVGIQYLGSAPSLETSNFILYSYDPL